MADLFSVHDLPDEEPVESQGLGVITVTPGRPLVEEEIPLEVGPNPPDLPPLLRGEGIDALPEEDDPQDVQNLNKDVTPAPDPLGLPEREPVSLEDAQARTIIPTMGEFIEELGTGLELLRDNAVIAASEATAGIQGGTVEEIYAQDPESLAFFQRAQERILANAAIEPQTLGGALTRDMVRALVAYPIIAKGMQSTGVGVAGQIFLGGMMTDLIAFSPDEPRASNALVTALNELGDPEAAGFVQEYLASDPDDPEGIKRFKQGMESLLLAGVTETAMRAGARIYRHARAVKDNARGAGVGAPKGSKPGVPTGTELRNIDIRAAQIGDEMLRSNVESLRVSAGMSGKELKDVEIDPAQVRAAGTVFAERVRKADTEGLLTDADIKAKRAFFEEKFAAKVGPKRVEAGQIDALHKAFEANELAVRQAEAFDVNKTTQKVARSLNKNIVDRSGNIKQQLLKHGPAGERAVMHLELSQGASTRADAHFRVARGEVFDGLDKQSKDQLNRLITLRRSYAIITRNPSYKSPIQFVDPKTGKQRQFTEAELRAALIDLEQRWGTEKFKKISERADKYFTEQVKVLNVLREEGIISEDEYIRLSRWEYSPTRFLNDELDPTIMEGNPKAGITSVRSSGISKLGAGTTDKILLEDHEMFMAQVMGRAYSRAAKNRTNKALHEFAAQHPNNPFVKLKKQIPKGQEDQYGKVSVMFDGKDDIRNIYIHKDFIQEWRADPVGVSATWTGFWGQAALGTAFIRPLATGINPEFVLTNMPRDFMFAWLTAGEGRLYSAFLPKGFAELSADIAAVLPDAFGRKGAYDEYIERGGGMPLLTHGAKTNERSFMEPGGRFGRRLQNLQHFLGYLNETSEIIMRLAIERREIRRLMAQKGGKPLTPDELSRATWEARRYLDFAQGGGMIKQLDVGIPYLNAGVQGFRGFIRAAGAGGTLPKGQKAMRFAAKASQLSALFGGLYAANRLIDPEGYDQVPDHVKNGNMILMMPMWNFTDKNGVERHAYIRVPIDHSAHWLKALTDSQLARTYGGRIPSAETIQVMGTFFDLFPDVSSLPHFSAVMAVAANHDTWIKEDIWKGSEFVIPEERTESRGSQQTGPLARDAANAMNESLRALGIVEPEIGGVGAVNLEVAARAYLPRSIYTDIMGLGWMLATGVTGVGTMGEPAPAPTIEGETRGDQLLARELEKSTQQMMKDVPFARRLFSFTHPIGAEEEEARAARGGPATQSKEIMDSLLLMTDQRRLRNPDRNMTAKQRKEVLQWIKGIDPIYRQSARRAFDNIVKIDKAMSRLRIRTEDFTGIPSRAILIRMAGAPGDEKAAWIFQLWENAVTDAGSDDPDIRRRGVERGKVIRTIMTTVPGFQRTKHQRGSRYVIALNRAARERGIGLPGSRALE